MFYSFYSYFICFYYSIAVGLAFSLTPFFVALHPSDDAPFINILVNVDLSNYYTKGEVNSKLSNKLDTNKIWTGTQDEWDALTATQQNSYIIAMIEI